MAKRRKSIEDVFAQRNRLDDQASADFNAGKLSEEEYLARIRRINNAAYSMTDRMNAKGRRMFGGARYDEGYKYSYNTRMGINNG